jgi:hypothetical protein
VIMSRSSTILSATALFRVVIIKDPCVLWGRYAHNGQSSERSLSRSVGFG